METGRKFSIPILERFQSVHDNEAILEDENLLSPEVSPPPSPRQEFRNECNHYHPNEWETIETTVVYNNGSRESFASVQQHHMNSIEIITDDGCFDQFWDYVESILNRFRWSIKTAEVYRNSSSVFNKVDKYAGRLFPLTFLLLNFIYWSSYMYIL